ncbi:hypothetical protein Tco_1359799 [Tanacetum coccineum]
MAFSDSEVHNDKPCSKSCLKNYKTLKKQYDDLLAKLHESKFKVAIYKRGLDTVAAQFVTYRKNEVLFSEEVAVLKREVGCKQYEINVLKIIDKSKKGLGYSAVPPPHPLIYNRPNKLDLSYSGLEEFQQPEFEGYGLRANKSVCENSSNETKKNSDAPLIEEWVSDNENEVKSPIVVEKKIVVPTIPKVGVVRPKQQEKSVRKIVRYAEMHRSQKPRGNQRNWNNQKSQQLENDFVMHNKACYICESFDHLQYTCKQKRQLNGQREEKPVWNNARRVNHQNSPRITQPNPKRYMVLRKILTRSGPILLNTNAVKRNRFNTVKASACWGQDPIDRGGRSSIQKRSVSITLKRLDYIDAQGRFKWMHRLRGGKSATKKKKNPEKSAAKAERPRR